jgi:RNA polymerase sigma-70 factor, ECF subfamily
MNYTTVWQDEIQMSRAAHEADAAAAEASATTASGANLDLPVQEKSDAQLVELVLAGDETAFEQIFHRHKRLAAFVAARYFRQPEQIEEIIQISFAKAFFELAEFRGERDASFAGWLGRIATNACLDVLRKQKRKPENLLSELSEAESEALLADWRQSDQSDAENSHARRDLAEKLLSRLSAEDRAILQMLDAEEMSVAEVAQITGWSKSKIKIRAFRARGALRKVLRKYL